MDSKRASFVIPAILLILIGLVPIVQMIARSLIIEGHFSLEKYRLVFQSPRSWELLFNTLILAGSVTFFSLLVGVPLGVLLGKTDLYFRRVLILLFLIPLMIPSYIFGLSWIFFLKGAVKYVSGFAGSFFVMVSTLTPIAIVLTLVYLHLVNPRLEEAARLTSTWPRTVFKVTLPLIKKGSGLAALVLFVLSLGEFGVPSLFRYPVFSAESFTQFAAFYDFDAAIAAAVPFGGIAVLILFFERFFLGRLSYESSGLTGFQQALRIPLGRWNFGITLGVFALALIFVAWPLGYLFLKSLSAQAYIEAFHSAGAALGRSLLFSFLAATCLTAIGLFLGYWVQRKPNPSSRLLDAVSIFLFALPGAVIGIGLISLWNTPSTTFIYSSPLILIFGYIAQYMALSSRMAAAVFSRISTSLEEAGEIAGASWGFRLRRILIPLARKGLLATWVVSFIFCLKDVNIAMMVYPPGNDTFPVRILTLMANGSEEMISALCMILFLVAALPFLSIWRLIRHQGVL